LAQRAEQRKAGRIKARCSMLKMKQKNAEQNRERHAKAFAVSPWFSL